MEKITRNDMKTLGLRGKHFMNCAKGTKSGRKFTATELRTKSESWISEMIGSNIIGYDLLCAQIEFNKLRSHRTITNIKNPKNIHLGKYIKE
jgi:hypothetical protein